MIPKRSREGRRTRKEKVLQGVTNWGDEDRLTSCTGTLNGLQGYTRSGGSAVKKKARQLCSLKMSMRDKHPALTGSGRTGRKKRPALRFHTLRYWVSNTGFLLG